MLLFCSYFPDYDLTKSDALPHILCAITGKGPLKTHYAEKIRGQHWEKVEFVMPWLEAEDYPRLLGK